MLVMGNMIDLVLFLQIILSILLISSYLMFACILVTCSGTQATVRLLFCCRVSCMLILRYLCRSFIFIRLWLRLHMFGIVGLSNCGGISMIIQAQMLRYCIFWRGLYFCQVILLSLPISSCINLQFWQVCHAHTPWLAKYKA